MGNSPASAKNKRKNKKYDSESQSVDDDNEYEEVEESYLEAIESEITPKQSKQSRLPRLEPPIVLPKTTKAVSPRRKESLYDRWKKPIRNATMFARHYAMTLHKFEVSVGMQQENFWLTNLDTSKEETSFRLSNQAPWRVTASDRELQTAMPEWNSVVAAYPNGRIPFLRESHFSDFRQPTASAQPRNRLDPQSSHAQSNEAYNRRPQTANDQREMGTNQNFRDERNDYRDYRQPSTELPGSFHDERPSHVPRENGQSPSAYGSNTRNEKASRLGQDDRRIENNRDSMRDVDNRQHETSFVKTTFRQSEANSEDIADNYENRCSPLDPCYDENCVDCINLAMARETMQRPPRPKTARDTGMSLRDMKIEVDREAMLENYLEKLAANKPSRVQKLLVDQYYQPREDKKGPPIIPNRISDALKRRLKSQSRDSQSEGRGSYIVQQLEEKLKTNLSNAEPALLTECGVKMIEDKHGNKVPIKLLKFVKDDSVYGKGSVNYGTTAGRYENRNIAYLSDGFQIKNDIAKQKDEVPQKNKKSYTNIKSSQLWPQNAKFDKQNLAKQLSINEKTRAKREVEALKHTLNYSAVKHHPRNLNYRPETDREISPTWGSPRESVKVKQASQGNRTSVQFTPGQPQQARTERIPASPMPLDSQASTARSYIRDRQELIRQAIEASEASH